MLSIARDGISHICDSVSNPIAHIGKAGGKAVVELLGLRQLLVLIVSLVHLLLGFLIVSLVHLLLGFLIVSLVHLHLGFLVTLNPGFGGGRTSGRLIANKITLSRIHTSFHHFTYINIFFLAIYG
jgi:hypothetical protein